MGVIAPMCNGLLQISKTINRRQTDPDKTICIYCTHHKRASRSLVLSYTSNQNITSCFLIKDILHQTTELIENVKGAQSTRDKYFNLYAYEVIKKKIVTEFEATHTNMMVSSKIPRHVYASPALNYLIFSPSFYSVPHGQF